MTNRTSTRTRAIDSVIDSFDGAFFKALCEPSRVAVLKRVMQLGRADIGEIAEGLPQERSVVSRHLQVLLEAVRAKLGLRAVGICGSRISVFSYWMRRASQVETGAITTTT